MSDWVHCNQCFCQPSQQRKFFLTSCGHLFCEECKKDEAKTKCLACGIICTTIILSAKMKPDVEIFFKDPLEIIKTQHNQLVQVMEFQKNHRQHLAAHRKQQQEAKWLSRLEATKRQLDSALELERRLQEENSRLRRLLSGSSGPGGAAKCSYRPGTPGGVLANASIPPNVRNMVYQNSSQSMSRSSSPYNSRLQQVEGSKTPQSQPVTPTRTPPGPARYSIRTPPVNGRIGTCNTPTGNMTLTPGGTLIRSANTPGGLMEMSTPQSSPMNLSPASSRRSYLSLGNIQGTPYGDCSSQSSMSSVLSQSSQSDSGCRYSQKNARSKRSPLSGMTSSQYHQVTS